MFCLHVIPKMNYKFFNERVFIYKKGASACEMYFMPEGRVNYLYGSDNLIFKTMPTGSYFGEIELLELVPREFSVLSEIECEMYVLPFKVTYKQYFKKLVKNFPLILK